MSKRAKEYIKIGENKLTQEDDTIKQNKYWWLQPKEQLATSVFSVTDMITNNKYNFLQMNFIYAQLYENIDTLINSTSYPLFNQYFDIGSSSQAFNSKLTFNVIKSCVDAATAKIAKNKPRVKFITNGGDDKLQRKAKQLTQYLDGLFTQTNIYEHATDAFRDGSIFGAGCLKVYVENDEIKVDRVLVPAEIIVDDADARYGKPKQLHQRKIISKDVLQSNFSEYKDQLETVETVSSLSVSPDQVIVIESWHLPSNKKANDGRHTICVNNLVLLDEKYEKDYFPFVFYKWNKRVQGFFGYGLTEELSFIQLAINKCHKMIQALQEFNTVPRVFVEAGSLLTKHALYDGGVQEYRTGANQPIFNTQPAAPGDLYAYLENLYNKAYQITGVSQLSAASQKPPGVNSGVALREYQDINTERFAIQGERYESLFIDVARIMIDLSRDLYKSNKNVTVKAKSNNKKFIESIDWKNCDLKDDQFNMDCFPVSKLPTTPEGRLAFVTELAQAGYIQQSQVIELMDMPDVENYFSLTNSSFDLTVQDMEKIIEEGEVMIPDPFLDLNMSKIIAQAYYLKSKYNKVDEDRLELIRNYVILCDNMLNPAPPENVAPVVNTPVDPMATAAAPPTSDLLPVG